MTGWLKKLLPLCTLVVLGTLLLTAGEPRKKRIAVLDFDYGTVHSNVAALFGSDVDVGRGITDLLVKYLVQDGTYSIIERKALDAVLAEQNFSNSNRANPTSAAQIGKLLGVDAIVVGSITQFGGETDEKKVGGAGGTWGGFGVGGFKQKKTKAIVTVDARIVDIDTAEIMAVADGHGESERSSTGLLGGGFSRGGFGVGGVDFSSSDFQETILGEAVKKAVEDMSTDVITANPKLQVRQVVVEGLVAFVNGGTVVLNVGRGAGLQVGDQLSVERVTAEITDPATGKVIRRMTDKLGVVEVTELDDVSAVCRIVTGSDFQVGDAVKTITQ
jgi:curli biogenesis system outer membrane secretion channel CsgG